VTSCWPQVGRHPANRARPVRLFDFPGPAPELPLHVSATVSRGRTDVCPRGPYSGGRLLQTKPPFSDHNGRPGPRGAPADPAYRFEDARTLFSKFVSGSCAPRTATPPPRLTFPRPALRRRTGTTVHQSSGLRQDANFSDHQVRDWRHSRSGCALTWAGTDSVAPTPPGGDRDSSQARHERYRPLASTTAKGLFHSRPGTLTRPEQMVVYNETVFQGCGSVRTWCLSVLRVRRVSATCPAHPSSRVLDTLSTLRDFRLRPHFAPANDSKFETEVWVGLSGAGRRSPKPVDSSHKVGCWHFDGPVRPGPDHHQQPAIFQDTMADARHQTARRSVIAT